VRFDIFNFYAAFYVLEVFSGGLMAVGLYMKMPSSVSVKIIWLFECQISSDSVIRMFFNFAQLSVISIFQKCGNLCVCGNIWLLFNLTNAEF